MAHLKIESIQLKTTGGYDAEIYGIDPASSDCLIGELKTQYGGTASWDIHGRCRDHNTDCNFDTRTDEFVDLERLARSLVNEEYL
ncbi:hypothetical protein [Marinobacter salarius]